MEETNYVLLAGKTPDARVFKTPGGLKICKLTA
jgi:hypothetical protein